MLDIGATPSVGGGGSTERLVLTSTETLHVPRPRFVGPQGLELVLPGGLARDDDVLLDVGALEDVGGPRLGVRELVQVTLAFGDRRVALLRVLGRQQRAERVVSDFTRVANVDWALDWAFDFATPRVAAPLVDVLLAVTGGHPRLTEVLFAAVVPAPGARSGWLTERDFEQALQRAETQRVLLDEVLEDLDGDRLALEVLAAVDEPGPPVGIASRADLIAFVAEHVALWRAFDETSPGEAEAAVARLEERGYLRRDRGGYAFLLAPIRALDRALVAAAVPAQ